MKVFHWISQLLKILSKKFEKIAADRTLEGQDNVSEYGLDNPTVTVSLKDKDGNEQTLQFGDTNSVTSSSYMTVNGDNKKIYMVPSTIVTSLQFDLNDLAEKEKFPSISDITGVSINKNGQTFTIAKDSASGTGWSVTGWDGTKKMQQFSSIRIYKAYNKYVMDRFYKSKYRRFEPIWT